MKRPRKVTEARWVAWHVIRRTFDEDAYTDRAFSGAASDAGLNPRDRAFAQRLAYGTVQRAKTLDHVIGVVGKRPLHKVDRPVLHALRLGMYELLVLRADPVASAHAAVDQAVELVRGVVGERAVAFTNAVLRRAQVDGAGILGALDPEVDAEAAVLLSMPGWLVARVRAEHGERGIEALAAQSGDEEFRALLDPDARLGPPAAIRAGTPLRILRPDAAQHIDLVAGVAKDLAPFPARLPDARVMVGPTAPLARFIEDGELAPQSLASMLAVVALDPRPGERVLDMCAAPGGKATYIASRVAGVAGGAGPAGAAGTARTGTDKLGTVLACELHEHRAQSIRDLAERTGTAPAVEVLTIDATTLDPAVHGLFDRVLLDAPCSGTGVLGGRPDSRWKRTPEDVAALAELQCALLATAARMVRPGGVVLYSTCSILVEEDEAIADRAGDVGLEPDPLPRAVPVALRLEGDAGRARTWPHLHGTDGFFLARFRRPDGPQGAGADG